jgi:glycosyltransferase involved in cell wall biosynthesis
VTRLHSFELYDWAPKINWQNVDKVILVSWAMQRKFCELYPDQQRKTVVIFNGVSLSKFRPTQQYSDYTQIGMLCNLLPIKRVYEMILTFYEIKSLGFPVILRVAGAIDLDKRYTYAINRLIEKLDLVNDVMLDGPIVDTSSWLNKIDIFISNSFWEGQQVALLEAMASGCYCLSHYWDGSEELLPTEYLYFTNNELREKILSYLAMSDIEKKSYRSLMREKACEKFDINQTKIKMMQLIQDLVPGIK